MNPRISPEHRIYWILGSALLIALISLTWVWRLQVEVRSLHTVSVAFDGLVCAVFEE